MFLDRSWPTKGGAADIYMLFQGCSKQEISPHHRFSSIQVNGYTFENKKYRCGTTSVPIRSLHKASETPARGLRGQA